MLVIIKKILCFAMVFMLTMFADISNVVLTYNDGRVIAAKNDMNISCKTEAEEMTDDRTFYAEGMITAEDAGIVYEETWTDFDDSYDKSINTEDEEISDDKAFYDEGIVITEGNNIEKKETWVDFYDLYEKSTFNLSEQKDEDLINVLKIIYKNTGTIPYSVAGGEIFVKSEKEFIK